MGEREREREMKVREIGREGVSFDILFWRRNEEIDVIRLREYNLFLFFNYNRNFLLFEIFREGTKQISYNANLMSGTLLNHFSV